VRILAAALVAAAAALALPALAAAHAELDSTDPPAGSEVATSPQAITLTFSEGVDASLSLVKVAGQDGAIMPGVSPVAAVPGEDAQLRVTLSDQLPKGVYSVNWLSVSSDDGHVDTGVFTFGVGEKPGAGAAVVVPLSHQSGLTDAGGAVGRWLLYAALILLVGAASTSLLVFGGRLPRGGVPTLWLAMVLGVVGLCVSIWVEKVLVGAPSLLPLFQTKEGKLLLAVAVALAFCAAAVFCVDLWPARWSLWLAGLAGSAAMLVHVLGGHAASSSYPALNVAVQWVHVTAVGVWIGGLFWLLLGLRDAEPEARSASVGKFVTVATSMLVIVLATGLVRGMVQIGSPGELLSTSYGRSLAVKVALVALLVALGALNHFFWAPAVRRGDTGSAPRRFGLNSRGELILAVCVLVATAVLTGLAPPPKPAKTASLPAVSRPADALAAQTVSSAPPLSSITALPPLP
jgi:copper transport protein